jgi:metal-responsive CopG/Arc/MetJ family transcriptional regulator
MSRLLSVSLPADLAEETDALAQSLGKTRSEVVRDALRRQVRVERFAALQR